MVERAAHAPAPPGRQALVLLGGLVGGFVVGIAAGAPFDIDVGAGHAVFHLVLALSLGTAAAWLARHGAAAPWSRFARWSAAALAVAQLAEGLAAVGDPRGDGAAHGVPSVVSLAVLQPLALVALGVLVVKAVRHRSTGAF